MPVTIELPAEAHARLIAEAARRGITLDQVIAQLAEHPDTTSATCPRHTAPAEQGSQFEHYR